MKNVHTHWTADKINAIRRSRGPAIGCVCVLVSESLGDDYSAVVSACQSKGDSPIDSLLQKLPSSIGIYAAFKSSNPDEIVASVNSPWNDETLATSPFSKTVSGIVFRKTTPDISLCDALTNAWDMFAERNDVEIVERWGAVRT